MPSNWWKIVANAADLQRAATPRLQAFSLLYLMASFLLASWLYATHIHLDDPDGLDEDCPLCIASASAEHALPGKVSLSDFISLSIIPVFVFPLSQPFVLYLRAHARDPPHTNTL